MPRFERKPIPPEKIRELAEEIVANAPVSRGEFDALREEYFKLERTVYGIQQLLGKAAEYQGKPRGRLPR